MIIGTIDIEPEDPSKEIKITEDIGYNPNKRSVSRTPNFNLNIIKEKKAEDIDKLTYQYLELIDSKKENPIKKEKKLDLNTNNYFDSILTPYQELFNEKNTLKKTMAFDGGTFLTDKINLNLSNIDIKSQSKKEEIFNSINNYLTNSNINNISIKTKTKFKKKYDIGYETVPELKKNIPVSFDKLIVNIKDEQNKPKPINPLFFIINGDKPIDKSKFINFRTNPSLFLNTSSNQKNYNTNINDAFNKNKIDINILSKTPKFSTCFNKICKDRSKLNYDIKKKIFNDKDASIEEKYKLLKDLQRNELMNRALGRGIFSCNKYFDDEKRALNLEKRKNFQKFFEDSKEKMVINLRKNDDIFDDKKKYFLDSEKHITYEYLPFVKDNAENKKILGKENKDKEIMRFNSGKSNKKFENLYKPEIKQRISNQILVDAKMDKILKKARFDYDKPYSYLASNIGKNK